MDFGQYQIQSQQNSHRRFRFIKPTHPISSFVGAAVGKLVSSESCGYGVAEAIITPSAPPPRAPILHPSWPKSRSAVPANTNATGRTCCAWQQRQHFERGEAGGGEDQGAALNTGPPPPPSYDTGRHGAGAGVPSGFALPAVRGLAPA